MKVWRGKPETAHKGCGAHVFEEVLSSHAEPSERKLYGWRCIHCGELRQVRVCAVKGCFTVYGQDLKPDSKQKMCNSHWQMHKDQYLREHPEAAKKSGTKKGGDNR